MEGFFGPKNFWLLVVIVMTIILAEFLYLKYVRKEEGFRFKNSVANFSISVFDRFFALMVTPIAYLMYHYVHENYAIWDIKENIWSVIVVFFAIDFLWYWYHRAGHRINILWGAHIVHHQSEDYNLTAALTITPFQAILGHLFRIILPIIGFPPEVVITQYLIAGGYQFFLHTTAVKSLGPLEWIFVTPSHHRVHHGVNEKYIDKNYGGTLIIWDRLFGTYEKEDEPVKYGITSSLKNRQFFWGLFHYWYDLGQRSKQLDTFSDKVKLFLKGPDWQPEGKILHQVPELYTEYDGYDYKENDLSYGLRWYVGIQIGLGFLTVSVASYYWDLFSPVQLGIITAYVLLSLFSVGRLMEKKKLAFHLELAKSILFVAASIWIFHNFEWFIPIVIGITLVSAVCALWFYKFRDEVVEIKRAK